VGVYLRVTLGRLRSDSIFPHCSIRLAPTTDIRPSESLQEVTSFRLVILCVLRVILYAGFCLGVPTGHYCIASPLYPSPFGSSVIQPYFTGLA
jgi:hypothetical protein